MFGKAWGIALLLSLTTPLFAESEADVAADDFDLFNIDGYRIYRYRSPTPAGSEHAVTINTETLVAMLKQSPKPALLDVQPVTWNRVFLQKEPRLNIPGSTWTPNVGLGEIDDDWRQYFATHLQRITDNNKGYPVVIYCRADCWMSWNALKRAHGWGYSNLYWYRDGSDGWIEHDYKTAAATPIPFKPSSH